MTDYDDLRAAFKRSTIEYNDYNHRAARYAQQFANGFREFLEAPVEFLDFDRETKKPYVALCKVTQNPSGPDTSEPANLFEALTTQDTGGFLFGVRIILEPAINGFPKGAFTFSIGFFPKEQVCDLRIAGQQFHLNMNDDADRVQPYQYMKATLETYLTTKPWEFQKRPRIGFIDHG